MSVDERDLELLTGIRSGKPSFYPEYRHSAERLRRVIHGLDGISRALVRSVEGPGALLQAVAEAAAEHLAADWVLFTLTDGALPDTGPRHLVLDADRRVVRDLAELPDDVCEHLRSVRRGELRHDHQPGERDHLHVPVTLDGAAVGAIMLWTSRVDRGIDATDRSVLRILAAQTAAALQNSALYQRTEQLLRRSEQLYGQASRHAEDLVARNEQLQRTQDALLAARQREVLDRERHRIARELHDSVTQYALSAGMQIEVCRAEVHDPRLRERLATAKDLTRRAVEQLRSAIYALNHAEDRGRQTLPSMLEELCGVHMPHDLQVEVRIEGRPLPLPEEAERSLFRVAGEALFNTAVHAGGTRAVVRLSFRPDRLVLSVADDGCGDPEAVRRALRVSSAGDLDGRHRGLANMQARARELGGTLGIRRAHLGGLRVQVGIPLPVTGPQTLPGGTSG